MRLFGKREKAESLPSFSVCNEVTPKRAVNTIAASNKEPLLIPTRCGHDNDNSNDTDVKSQPSWGEKQLGPIRLRDEWGQSHDSELRDEDVVDKSNKRTNQSVDDEVRDRDPVMNSRSTTTSQCISQSQKSAFQPWVLLQDEKISEDKTSTYGLDPQCTTKTNMETSHDGDIIHRNSPLQSKQQQNHLQQAHHHHRHHQDLMTTPQMQVSLSLGYNHLNESSNRTTSNGTSNQLTILHNAAHSKGDDTYHNYQQRSSAFGNTQQHPQHHHQQQQNHQNDDPISNPETLVIAQMIQWKFAAEEGSLVLRFAAVLAALSLIVTSILPYGLLLLSMEEDLPFTTWTTSFSIGHLIVSSYVIGFAILIIVIDGRSYYARDPLGSRALIRNCVMRHVNVLRLVWGRGVLYLIVGILHLSQELWMCYVSGAIMVGIGIIAILSGYRAYRNLGTLRRAVTDTQFLVLEFARHDRDKDGFLNSSEFAQFIWDLGIEFDDLYTLKAFTTIDIHRNNKISFPDFAQWWSQIGVSPPSVSHANSLRGNETFDSHRQIRNMN